MPGITMIMNGDGAFKDISPDKVLNASETKFARLAFLDKGMTSGNPSVALMIPLDSGDFVFLSNQC